MLSLYNTTLLLRFHQCATCLRNNGTIMLQDCTNSNGTNISVNKLAYCTIKLKLHQDKGLYQLLLKCEEDFYAFVCAAKCHSFCLRLCRNMTSPGTGQCSTTYFVGFRTYSLSSLLRMGCFSNTPSSVYGGRGCYTTPQGC